MEDKGLFSIFVPCSLKMLRVMLVATKAISVRAKPFAGVGRTSNVELAIDRVNDLVNELAFHDVSYKTR